MNGIPAVQLRPSPTDFNHHSITRDIDTGDALGFFGIAVIAFLILGSVVGLFKFGVVGGGGGGGGGGITACSTVPSTTSQQFKFTASAYSADSALTAPNANVYSPSTGWANLGADNPGSLSSAVTTGGSYSQQGGLYVQFTATGANPIWAPLNGQTFSMGSVPVVTAQSTPGATAGTCVWLFGATPIQAPGSGTSSTTNVIANVLTSGVTSLTVASVVAPTTQSLFTAQLNIKQAYKGLGYPINVVSIQSATVVNYQSGQTVPLGSTQTFQPVLIISINRTDYVVNLDSSAPSNLVLQTITNPAATASTLNYVVSGFTGCAPAGASVSSYTCLSAPINIYQSDTGQSGHADFTFIWVDMQQPAYVISRFTNPAAASYPASGAASGIPTSFSFLVPTTAPNGGAPTVLIQQSYSFILKRA